MCPTRTASDPLDVPNKKMTLKIRTNKKEIVIEAVPDDCSFHTFLNVYPEKEEINKFENFYLDKGNKGIKGRVITGHMYFNDKLTTKHIIFVENYPKNIIGWHQLKDMGLLKVDTNKKHVVDVPPVFLDNMIKPGYANEVYLNKYLIGDAKRVIASWERKGIIEKRSSFYNSSVKLTMKLNGKVKILFYYSDLNKDVVLMSNEYEQNRNKVIAGIPLGQFYSVIKLYYGEWQIPLDTNTKFKTAFTFLGEQYVWNRLPGKFRNSTAILGKTLGQILDKLPQNVRKHVTYYVDKMLISADTKKDCRQFTDLLFNHLEDNGFEMQETDNQICQAQVEYLRRKICPEGIGLDEKYLQKVQEIGSPRSAKELWSILSTLEDARRFTPGFGVFTEDLYKLRNNKQLWCWKQMHQDILNALICEILKNRLVVPGLTEEDTCTVQIFVIDGAWMAEVLNSARKPYRSESGTFAPVKQQETLAVKELKAMKGAWSNIKNVLQGRDIVWEVESPELACYKENPNSVDVNKKLDLSFLSSPQHNIKVVPSCGRKLPIQWPVHV